MLYRQIGKTGQKASILGFGCMRLPVINGKNHLIDEEKATAMVDYALRNGVNYFDTAYVYHSEIQFHAGMSEVFLGKALKHERKNIYLATKLPSWLIKTRDDMDRYLDHQLERLQTDHIDFYLLHGMNADKWKILSNLDVTGFLEAALADGRIKYAGFSFHDQFPLFREIVDSYDWSFCQIQYNYMDENYQAGRQGLQYAAAKDLGIIIMEPLRGGSLTARLPANVQKIWDAADIGRTPAEWALRFLWDKPEINVVLSGMTEMEHVVENIRIASEGIAQSLTDKELALIQEVKSIYQARTKVDCTGCHYCMPCPQGVNIPICFLQLNNALIYNDHKTARLRYNNFLKEQQRASNCVKCGRCEEACPQHIPIKDMLKEVVLELENTG
ncbi:MAG TPA: aldo/keto reductase [Methylomusa anaerophila]|uniref:General stress protein 69 n=1 Tax=Methylomusa anaerophila TaxID=1930071 RepID=A0A348AF53_9FIRM|nr:aldo/keto reductase [Methylomusa anaerophila]BBB89701.1 general stress protein 69 [Methylomusa anaerophila]HML89255.1 aldo/keto reductase [Methylomusa anaerophila]